MIKENITDFMCSVRSTIEETTGYNQKDPILRELFDAGFKALITDEMSNRVILKGETNENSKIIDLFLWRETLCKLTFITGSNLTGNTHSWVSERDGSAKKLRSLISI